MTEFSSLIKEIHSIFSLKLRKYILFSLKDEDRVFLYFFHTKQPVKGLLYGYNLLNEIPRLLEDPSIECLECNLASQIIGGISFDNNEIVESNISIEECNIILAELKKELKINTDLIQLF